MHPLSCSSYKFHTLWVIPSLPNKDCYYRQNMMLQCRLKRRHAFISWQLHNDKCNLVWLPRISHLFTIQVHYIPAEYWQSSYILRLSQLNNITSDSYNWTTVQLSLSYFLLQALSISCSAYSAVFGPRIWGYEWRLHNVLLWLRRFVAGSLANSQQAVS